MNHSGRLWMRRLDLMQNNKVSVPKSDPAREPFITIDDLVQMAQALFAGLNKLSEYKHPLDIRRGIRKGVRTTMSDEKQSKQIKAAGRTYFMDVEKTKAGKPYLRITESRKGGDDNWERASINVFPEDADEFGRAVAEMIEKIG